MKLKERFNAWVQGMVDAAVARHVPDPSILLAVARDNVDYYRLASSLADSAELRRSVAKQITAQVIDEIDTGRIAEQIAETISAEDVAYHMDAEDVAGHVEVDADDIAEKVAEDIDVSSCIDYDTLCEKMVDKLKEAWA
jgi:hypothetical protein